MKKFWPELQDYGSDIMTSGEFWPEGIRNYLIKYAREKHSSYPIFFGNTPCSIAYALGKPDIYGHFNRPACLESTCPQRALCSTSHSRPTIEQVHKVAISQGINPEDITLLQDRISIKGAIESGKITHMRYALRCPVISESIDYSAGYNWANVREEGRIIEIPWKDNWTKNQ